MSLRPFKSLLFHFARNRVTVSFLLILTVVILATGYPIAAYSHDEGCGGLFSDASADATVRRKEMIQQYSRGAPNFTGVRTFALNAATLPYSEKQTLLLDIGAIYRLVPKKDPRPTARWHIGGRRLLDYAQTMIARTDEFFKTEIASGATGTQTYRKFMKQQQELFASNYGATEVLVIIRTLQKNLQALQPVGTLGAPHKLLLAGSFINGKANLQKSDIDMSVSAPILLREIPAWEKQVNEALGVSLGGVATQMIIEGHGEPAGFYGRLNPLVIEITRDTIRILVFEPATVRQSGDELTVGPVAVYPMVLE